MLVKDFVEVIDKNIGYLPIVDGSGRYADLMNKEKLLSKFEDYEIIAVSARDEDYLVLNISEKHPCEYYKTTRTERRPSDYERGVYFGRYGLEKETINEKWAYCTATKQCNLCYCGGDKKKCELSTK